jgi:hypothetical protein
MSLARRTLTGAVALAVVAAILALPAFAAEVSRTEYKAAAEPICKADTQANERILAGVRKEVQQGKLKPAASRFTEASLALKKALHELEQVPRPGADEARLAGWFSYVKIEAELFATAGHKLRSGDKPGAEKIVNKLTQNADKANLQVLPFDFRYCRLEPARFT